MNIEEQRALIMSQCKIYAAALKEPSGGQTCGIMPRAMIVEHEELRIKISVNYYRSQHKNRQIGMTLMELALLDIIN